MFNVSLSMDATFKILEVFLTVCSVYFFFGVGEMLTSN